MKENFDRIFQSARYGCALGTLIVLSMSGPVLAAGYQVVDLGAYVRPEDINALGEVVGAGGTDQYPSVAFRWNPATGFQDLDGTVAYGISDSGTVAGSTLSGAFVIDGGSYRAWDGHSAFGVNGLGQVAGSEAGRNPYRETSIPYNPAVLDGGRWTVMDIAQVYPRGTRPGVYADVYVLFDINDSGFAVGRKSRYGLVGSSAILIEPPYTGVKSAADVAFLPTPAGGSANAINEANRIVGTTGNDSRSGSYSFAFLYDGADVVDLGTLGGLRSGANDINDLDQVVGFAETGSGNHAFLWEEATGMQDLNDLLAADGWVFEVGMAINNAGEIVGTGLLHGQPHGFLLTTDEPPAPLNQPPVAVIGASATSGKGPLEVRFSGDASYDPESDPLVYQWDFGDGTTASTANPVHVYADSGTYVCVLTVTDTAGRSGTTSVDITVKKGNGKTRT